MTAALKHPYVRPPPQPSAVPPMGSPASKQHVAFVAFPFGSHPGAIFPVARAVAAAAPSAVVSFLGTVRALASLPPADDTPNLRFVAVADGVPDGSPPPREVLELIGLFLEATPGNLKEGMAAAVAGASGAPVSCVVSDAFVWMSGEVAEEMRVPWVPLCPGGTAALSAHLHTDLLRRKLGVGDQAIAGREDELLDFIPGLSVHRVRDLPEGVVAGPLDSPFSVLLHRMAERLPKAAAIAFNTIPGLEPAIEESFATVFSKPFTIGPFHILAPPSAPAPDPNRCLPWLDRHRPNAVAYVSFGSIMTPPPAELAQLAEGLEASGVPFIWSLKETARECLPSGFLERTQERGMVVGWAPQLAVLDHPAVGAFLTHCGWNSVLEGIAAGVPMACRPLFGDHRMIARSMMLSWGNGIGFEGEVMTKDGVLKALDTLLRGEEGKRLRARAAELKVIANRAVAPGGTSTKNFASLLDFLLPEIKLNS
ncbi:hypothetical protein GW17_00055946 [Ensete ventricosum]|nr:hypothetical protein GW17_00055946 [Ensete ventricosum]